MATTDPCQDAPKDWRLAYRDVKLRTEYAERWRAMRTVLGPHYAAIHVRRTDHEAHRLGRGTTDAAFVDWCSTVFARSVDGGLVVLPDPCPVFIACDNGTTQRKLVETIGALPSKPLRKVPVTLAPIAEHAHQDEMYQRNTSLPDSALDLFLCAGSSAFKGSHDSSFTNTIHTLREIRGWWT